MHPVEHEQVDTSAKCKLVLETEFLYSLYTQPSTFPSLSALLDPDVVHLCAR
jgi:hypothetical protein